MSETESKQENTNNDVSVSESTQKLLMGSETINMNSSQAHNTYAQLICREDNKNKKSNPLAIQEMKDISELRPSKKGETTYDMPKEEINSRKKLFGAPKDLVEKNLDGSKGEDLQKGKYLYGKKRFDHLGVMKDFSKNIKPEEKFKCEAKKFQTSTFTKRVNDCYKVNPMEILDKKKQMK